jgi:hypothetical protein
MNSGERTWDCNSSLCFKVSTLSSSVALLVQKCLRNPGAGVVKMLAIEYIHRTTSSMMHNHKYNNGYAIKIAKHRFSRSLFGNYGD